MHGCSSRQLPACQAATNARNQPLHASSAPRKAASEQMGGQMMEHARELHSKVFSTDKRPVILFDGVCNLCNGAVNFTLDWDTVGHFRYAALQSEVGRGLLQSVGKNADDISSIVLVEPDRFSVKSEAVLRIGEGMKMPISVASWLALTLVPRFIADVLYEQVANNRYKLFGEAPSCRLSDTRFTERFISDASVL